MQIDGVDVTEADEGGTERKLPWLIDVFLYPACLPGMITLGVLLGIRIAVDLAVKFLELLSMYCAPLLILALLGFYVGILIKIALRLFLLWYVCECIRDSAVGGLRAPETIANPPGLSELFRAGFVWLVFWGPPIQISRVQAVPYYFYIASGLFRK